MILSLFFYFKVILLISFKTLRSLCIDFIIFFIPAALLWLAFPKLLGIFLPFLLGYVIYLAANPLCRRLKKIFPPSVCALLSISLISLILFFVFRILLSHLTSEIALFTRTNNLYRDAVPFISRKISSFSDSRAGDFFTGLFDNFHAQLSDILLKISTWIFNFAKNIPSLLITVFTTVFTAYFLLKDAELFFDSAKKFLGENMCLKCIHIKDSFLRVVFTYLRAQLLIGSIIFTVLFLGFSYLDIGYSLLLAFFTAVVDVFPILGTGTVLVPLSVFFFLTGNSAKGWGLLILYGVAVLTRQLCEPKIIGSKLGIHPLLTIFSIYAGMKILGFWGLLLGPIAALLTKNLLSVKKP